MSAPRLRVLIVDDEPLAREGIRLLLERDPEIEVCGECYGEATVAAIATWQPDILFLDIQMPGMDGLAVLERVGAKAVPAIVFVTAFDRYALRAFEVHALDYLLKPFSDTRFADALARAKSQARAHRDGALGARLEALLRERGTRAPTRFLVPARDKTLVIESEQIDWIEAADYYVCLHLGSVSHLLRETMDEIERQLDPAHFVRVHRSAIVNLSRVRELHPLFRGDCQLLLEGGATVRLSRHRRAEFEARFSQAGLRR